MFFSRSCKPDRHFAPSGSPIETLYAEKLVNGVVTLVESGHRDVNEYIQSSRDDCDVYSVIERFNRGDVSALNQVDGGQFMDVIGLPTNLAQAQQMLIDVQSRFDNLPASVKQKFDNSASVFVDRIANGGVQALIDSGLIANNVGKEVADNVTE